MECTNEYTFPIRLIGCGYTYQGSFLLTRKTNFDIVDFIPDMKENKLTIEIPEGKIVDWEESKKQNKIVLKDKQLTYEDVCNKLKDAIDITLFIEPSKQGHMFVADVYQLERIIAKNMLANVAKYLNGEWKPWHDKSITSIVVLKETKTGVSPCEVISGSCSSVCGSIWFKTKDLARQAIEILGEETVKLALEPLGI